MRNNIAFTKEGKQYLEIRWKIISISNIFRITRKRCSRSYYFTVMKKRFFPSILISATTKKKKGILSSGFLSSILISSNKKKKKIFSILLTYRDEKKRYSWRKIRDILFSSILISFNSDTLDYLTVAKEWYSWFCLLSTHLSNIFYKGKKKYLLLFYYSKRKIFLIFFSSILISFILTLSITLP